MKNRPPIHWYITQRSFFSFDAKNVKKIPFDDTAYTTMVLTMIEQGNNLDYQENGWTLLHGAISNREWMFAQALIRKGLNVNAQTDKGVTPLHLAVEGYRGEESDLLIELLLENGANPDIGFGGMSAKEFAAICGCEKFFIYNI